MSSTYISRQPIFDNNMNISGYALMSDNNQYSLGSANNDKSTATLLDDILLVEFDTLTENTRGFIKFTKKLLVDEAPLLFPQKSTIIELSGNIDIDDLVIEACKELKSKGYLIALDDFDLNRIDKYLPIMDYLDIAKIEFEHDNIETQKISIKVYSNSLVFLAKNVETREDYNAAKQLGYKLFQGSFYSKPVTVNKKEIGTFSSNLVLILNELYKQEPDINIVTSAFERDVELSYKVLRMVNSAYYGVKYHTDSLRMALIQIGNRELIRWINVMLIKGFQNPENEELIKTSIIRGKMLAILAIVTNNRALESNYFISGMFSSIDVLLNDSMENIIDKLPLGDDVCKTLLGEKTPIKIALDAVIEYEQGNWDLIEAYINEINIGQEEFISLYIDAIKWQKSL